MKKMNKLKKQYQVWTYSEGSAYSVTEYDTLAEAVLADKYGDNYYITKRVDFEIHENNK